MAIKNWEPNKSKNFNIELINNGRWSENEFGKWLMLCKSKNNDNGFGKINECPTWNDALNYITGLLECEVRNFPKHKKIEIVYEKIQKILDAIKPYMPKQSEDKLTQIFDKQIKLQQRLGYKLNDLVANQEFINTMTIALNDELMESIRETPWKPWKKNQTFNQEKYKEELVDLLHFFVNLCLAAGMDSNELFERYLNKNKINYKRQDENY